MLFLYAGLINPRIPCFLHAKICKYLEIRHRLEFYTQNQKQSHLASFVPDSSSSRLNSSHAGSIPLHLLPGNQCLLPPGGTSGHAVSRLSVHHLPSPSGENLLNQVQEGSVLYAPAASNTSVLQTIHSHGEWCRATSSRTITYREGHVRAQQRPPFRRLFSAY